MKKIVGILSIMIVTAACNTSEQHADPTDTLSPQVRDTFEVSPSGTRGLDTTAPLTAPGDTTGLGNDR